jgi:hypothetical protein
VCNYSAVGHYVTGHTTISGVRVYPGVDLNVLGPIQAIVSPQHPRIAVPTDATGYVYGVIGLFGVAMMLVLLYIAFLIARAGS